MHDPLTPDRREEIRRQLLQELAALSGEGDRIEQLTVEPEPDELDQGQTDAERDVIVEKFDQEARTLADIRAALDKLNSGGYGVCESCDRPIPEKRMNALPWARFCVKCKSRVESAQTPGPRVGAVASVMAQEN